MRRRILLSLLGWLALILSGCGAIAATPTASALPPTAIAPATTLPPTAIAPATTLPPTAPAALPPTAAGADTPLPTTAATSVPAPTVAAAGALQYLLPPQVPAGYQLDPRDPAFAAPDGFMIQLRPVARGEQRITIEGGAPIEEIARSAEETLHDPQATGALFLAVTVRGQPGVFQSSGYGSRITWREQGVPYSLLSPYDQDAAVAFANALVALDREAWLQRNRLATAPDVGMWIVGVEPGSPAATAGFRAGQVLISLNDTLIDTAATANAIIGQHVHETLDATVWDSERRIDLQVTPQEPVIGLTLCALARCAPQSGVATAPSTGALPAARALYACAQGLCLAAIEGGVTRLLTTFPLPAADLAGFAIAPDGATIAYGLAIEEGAAAIFVQPAAGGEARRILTVKGAESGIGGWEGYGVLGFSAASGQLLIEDEAQVVAVDLDGTGRRPVTDPMPYGASSTHHFMLAPAGDQLMVVSSASPNSAAIYRVADGSARTISLPADQEPVALVGSAPRLLIARVDPPIDPDAGNPAAQDPATVGYLLADLDGRNQTPLPPMGDGAGAPRLVSSVAGVLALVQRADGSFALVDLLSGRQTPVPALPGRLDGTAIALRAS